jgi:hypothetical protein
MKLKLDVEEMAEDFFEDTRLLGIMAPVKDYLFCWQVNHHFCFNFRLNNEIEIQLFKKRRNYFFTVFEYQESHHTLVHYLYNNKYDGEYLLPEFKHIDFLWLFKGDMVSDAAVQATIKGLRAINGVQLVNELTYEHIKNKGHLIF